MNIIISRTDKIGDLVLSIPSFFRLRQMFPSACITVLVRSYNFEIVKNLAYINRIIKVDEFSKYELVKILKEIKPEYFIALFTNRLIGYLAHKSGAKFRIGPFSKIHSFFFYNRGVWQKRSKSIKNEAYYNLDLVKKINPRVFDSFGTKINTQLNYDKKNYEIAESFIKVNKIDLSKKTIFVFPFSASSAMNLSLKQYQDLINVIKENKNVNIILGACGYDAKIANQFKGVYVFVNNGSILNLAALIDRCDLYIGGSTGPTHIAASLQKQIISFYSKIIAQSTTRWGVINNKKVEYFIPKFDCNAKLRCNEKCKYYDCFQMFDINKIANIILTTLAQV